MAIISLAFSNKNHDKRVGLHLDNERIYYWRAASESGRELTLYVPD